MFPHHHQKEMGSSAKAFTISKIAVFLSLLIAVVAVVIPVYFSAVNKAREAKAARDASAIADAVNRYYRTYEVYPIPLGYDHEIQESNALLMNILSGADAERNPRGIGFFRGSVSKKNCSGRVYSMSEAFTFYADPWGRPYQVLLDHDYDGRVGGQEGLPDHKTNVVCYSAGKDGDFRTRRDNIAYAVPHDRS